MLKVGGSIGNKMIICVVFLLLFASLVYGGELTSGSKTVASAGVRERVTSLSTFAQWVDIQAKCSNTGNVYIGGTAVSSLVGITLTPCSMVSVGNMAMGYVLDLTDVWVDSAVNGEGVVLNYWSIP